MKKLFYRTLLKIIKRFKPQTQLRLGMRLLDDHIRANDPLEAYKLRRHLLDKYTKSYPTLYSHEATRIYGFFDLFKDLKSVPGDLVECGVGRGRFLTIFAFANQFFQMNRDLYGFDSFQGFPVASKQDFGTRVKKEEKITGWDDVTPELIYHILGHDLDAEGSKSTLDEQGVKRVKLIPGYFNETLERNLPERIAFLHLDADLYQSTVDVLQACLPRMSHGGVLVFDELHEEEKWPGVKQAVDEICHPLGLTPVWHKALQRYIIHMVK